MVNLFGIFMEQKNKLNDVQGSCLCGSVKFELFGDVDGFYLCHCSVVGDQQDHRMHPTFLQC